MKEINIVDYIPVGRENGLRANELASMLSITTRDVRRMISQARGKHVIINMQDGNGYFIPAENETYVVGEWFNQETRRIRKTTEATKGARDFLKNHK